MTIGNLLRRASRYKGSLALISALALFGSISLLTIPALAGTLLGGAVSGVEVGTATVTLLLVAALVLTALLTLASNMVTAATSAKILADLRCEVFDHITHLPLQFHDQSRHGDLIALATYEAGRLSGFLTSTLANVPAMLVTSLGATVMLFLIDPALAFVIPVLIPLFYIALKLLSRRLRGLATLHRESEATVYAEAESNLQMLMITKAFAAEGKQGRRYAAAVDEARGRAVAMNHASAAIGPVSGLLAGCAAIFVIVTATSQSTGEQNSPAELFSFLLYAALLTRPISALTNVYGQWQMAKGTLGRLEHVLQVPPEAGYDTGTRPDVRGAIAFEKVRFSYPGRTGPLRTASLQIAPGEIVALVGENGSGKSTLVKLLLRFYEPDEGRITLDGLEVTQIDLQYLRRQIGYVPQWPRLFNGTIRENITFGTEHPDASALERAMELAQARHFIAGLPNGLDTVIGDDGVRLSGGQRQRLALARAILADPPILIFDEATSMWDIEGEASFVESCKQALAGRTVIIVTHRPASLSLADRIILVRDGVVEELDEHAKVGLRS